MSKKKQRGIIFIICSAFCFALMNCFVKLSGDLPTAQKSFFRNFVAFVIALLVLLKSGMGFKYRVKDVPLYLVRSVMGTVGILGNFYAIDHMNVANASMLNKMSPFFAILFSFFFLQERPKLYQVIGVIVAFVGALFVMQPSADFGETLPAIVGFVGGMGAGCAYTAVRALGERGVKGPHIVLFFSAFSCIAVLPLIAMDIKPMSVTQVIILLLAGVAAAGGQFSVTAAYTNAPAKEISVFDYTQILFATAMGFLFFGELPDMLSIVGYIIICSVSLFFFYKAKREDK